MTAAGESITRSFFDRILGAARLDDAVYEEVEHDRSALGQAALVVVLTSLAAGIGGIAEEGVSGFIGLTLGALVAWAVYAWLTYFIGTRLLAGPQTVADWGEVARALGFAQSPRFLLILGVVPVLAVLVGLVVFVWVLITTVIALRTALDFSTGRAIGTAIIGWLAQVIILGIVYGIIAA